MSYGYNKTLDSVSYGRYWQKLKTLGLDECPYDLPADSWKNDPTKWPEVLYPDIYSYLIDTPGIYTKESMKNFKSLEAHKQFRAGWVQTIFHMKVKGSKNVIFKTVVRPSWAVNDDPHNPWVAVDPDGTVLVGHCDCTAGLGESCSHVASLLFKIEAAVRNGYTTVACTDQACQWNQCFVKKIQPSRISKIKFYKQEVKDRLKSSKRKKKRYTPATEIQQKQYVQELHEIAKSEKSLPVGLSLFKETYSVFSFPDSVPAVKRLPMSMQSLHSDKYSKMSSEELKSECEKVKDSLKVTEAEVSYLSDSTVKQSSSSVWHEQRTGRITASVAHSVIHTKVDAPAPSVIKNICYPDNRILNVPAILWGREREHVAFKAYKEVVSPLHSDCKITETGLRICLDKPFIGASPDGLVSCACHGDGVVEIKCPYKFRDNSIAEMIASDGFHLSDTYQLNPTHSYYTQVQQQMYVFGCHYCHFVVWTNEGCVVTHVARDHDFISELVLKIDKFWLKYCLPELLTHRMLETSKCTPDRITVVDTVHCFCGQPDNESVGMIGCDSDTCKYKWFHFPCVKIKRPPKGSWYCLECRKRK